MRGKTQIAYATNSGDDDMFLSHTTVLRGVNHLTLERNRQTNLVEQAVALDTNVRLSDFQIPFWKYQTAARKQMLIACRQFIRALNRLGLVQITEFAPQGLSP